jgi:hypothetical protein
MYHINNLLKLNFKQMVGYISEKVHWHLMVGKISIFNRLYLRYIKRSLPELILLDLNLTNSQAGQSYLPGSFPGKLTLFRCKETPWTKEDGLDLAWGLLALGGVEIYHTPGRHTSIMEEPDVRYLAEELTRCLAKIQHKKA